MLRKRLIASFFLITPVLFIFWLDTNWNFGMPGIWTIPFAVLVSFAIAGELLAMIRDRSAGATAWVVYTGVLLCQLAVIAPELLSVFGGEGAAEFGRWQWSILALAATTLLAFVCELSQFSEERHSTSRVALAILVVMYSSWLVSFLVATRVELDNYKGVLAVFSMIFIIKMSDAGAYFIGKRFGRRKLAPVLSPGKTVEGLFGGMAAAVLASLLVFWLIAPSVLESYSFSWLSAMAYGVSISVVGVFGDLSESMIKRDMQCKDSSGWLPGLGGIMDTADSVLLAAPVAYLWWSSGLL